MHLHHDAAAGVEVDADALRQAPRAPAGRPGGDPGCVVELVAGIRPGRRDARPPETRPARARLARVELLGCRDRGGRHAEQDHVVDDGRNARLDPGGCHEGVLGQLWIDEEAAIIVRSATRRRRRIRRGEGEHTRCLARPRVRRARLRRADPVAVDLRPRAQPAQQGRPLAEGERAPRLAAIRRRGLARRPWWHSLRGDGGNDQVGSHRQVVRRPERERCDAAEAVAAGALVADDRRHVACEAGGGGARVARGVPADRDRADGRDRDDCEQRGRQQASRQPGQVAWPGSYGGATHGFGTGPEAACLARGSPAGGRGTRRFSRRTSPVLCRPRLRGSSPWR